MSNPEFFQVGQNRIAYRKTGTGKPLLILHGWGSSSIVMLPVAQKLNKIRTSYLIDFPGFGDSPEPDKPWSVDDYTGLVKRFISKVIPEEKTDIFVHSYGARVLLKLLSDPESAVKIDKVIITGGAGLKPKRKPVYYLKKYTAKTLKLPFFILPEPLREKGLQKLRNTPLWKMLGSSDYQKLSGVMRETFVKSVTEYLDALLPEINHEVLLIWGENDTSTPLEQGKRMEQGIKSSALVEIKNAGHYAFLDQPAKFDAIVKAYLEPK